MRPATQYESENGIVATCSGCHAQFTAETWQALPLVGHTDYQEDGDRRIELRNCTCRAHSQFTRSALLAHNNT